MQCFAVHTQILIASDIEPYIQKNDWILFDADGTLMNYGLKDGDPNTLIDPGTPDLMDKFKKMEVKMMILTARDYGDFIYEELHRLGICKLDDILGDTYQYDQKVVNAGMRDSPNHQLFP